MKKLKSESGSAMILALFLMILVSIVMISFSNQVANQIRSTINLDKNMQEKYNAESDIDRLIKYFIKGIDIVYKDDGTYKYEMTYKNLGYIKENEEEVSENESGKVIMKMTAKQIESTDSGGNQLQDNVIKIPSNKNNVTFQLEIIEVNNENIKSSIKVNVIEINGTSGNEKYKIDYGVESWRQRN